MASCSGPQKSFVARRAAWVPSLIQSSTVLQHLKSPLEAESRRLTLRTRPAPIAASRPMGYRTSTRAATRPRRLSLQFQPAPEGLESCRNRTRNAVQLLDSTYVARPFLSRPGNPLKDLASPLRRRCQRTAAYRGERRRRTSPVAGKTKAVSEYEKSDET